MTTDEDIENLRQELLEIRMELDAVQNGGWLKEPEISASQMMNSGSTPGCFEVKHVEDSSITLENCWFRVGGSLKIGDETMSGNVVKRGFIALKVGAKGTNPTIELASYADYATMMEASQNTDYYIAPLYKFGEGGDIEVDLRNMPLVDMVEF